MLPEFEPHPGQDSLLFHCGKRTLARMRRRLGNTELMSAVTVTYPRGAVSEQSDGQRGSPCGIRSLPSRLEGAKLRGLGSHSVYWNFLRTPDVKPA